MAAPSAAGRQQQRRSEPPAGVVRNEDCRDALPCLADGSVSLVLTDPPYFLDGMGDDWDTRRLRRRTKHGVVGGLPSGQKFDSRQGQRLYEFLLPVAEQLHRVLKPGGFLLGFAQARLQHRSALAYEDAGFEIRDTLAWTYEGQAEAFSQDHFVERMDLTRQEKDRILGCLGNRKTPQLKPQMELITLAQKPREGTFVNNWLLHRTGLIDVSCPHIEPDRFPGQLVPCLKQRRGSGFYAVKPVDVCRHLIRIFSAPDDVVLDPFSGTGSTGVAAVLEGRQFLGFEVDSETANEADRNLTEALARC